MKKTPGQGVARRDLERLVELFRPVMLDHARRFCRDRVEAEDLVQDTVVRALENAHRLRSLDGARAWLVTIMSNLFLDGLRRDAGRSSGADPDQIEVPIPDPEPAPSWADVTPEAFNAALAQLDEEFRVPFVMAEIDRKSHDEIARALGIKVGTVATRILRARRKLKQMLLPGGSPGDEEDK